MIAFSKKTLTGIFSRKTDPLSMPVGSAGYVVVDTELTGLDLKRDSIISIGGVKMKGGRIDLGSVFYRMINPASEMDHRGIVVHGITPSDVAEKPASGDVLSEFAEFCGDDIIVGHFISLDMDFINKEMKSGHGRELKNRTVDTCRLYEWIRYGEGSFSSHYTVNADDLNLFAIAREYGIPVSGAHNALSDAFITAQLFQRFLSIFPGLGVSTLKGLLKIGRP